MASCEKLKSATPATNPSVLVRKKAVEGLARLNDMEDDRANPD